MSLPSACRSRQIWFSSELITVSGASSPHTSSTRRCFETNCPARSSIAASNARCLGGGGGRTRSPSRTSSGPRRRNSSTRRVLAPCVRRDNALPVVVARTIMRGVRGLRWCAVAFLGAILGGASATPTPAAFPGRNGLIAFSSRRDGNYELYTMQPDASNQTRLTRDPAADIDPAWSPDGGRIAFTSDRDGNPEIYVAAADGSGVVQLTQSPGFNVDPTWSPDGRRTAFTSNREGGDDIYAMN